MNIAVISTDWHIDAGNVELSKNLAAQQIQFAKSSGVNWLICLGDVFESRKAQPEIALNCFKDILDMVYEEGMRMTVIPGNHDKTDYGSWSSFLRPFKEHPALELIEKSGYHGIVGEAGTEYGLVFQSFAREDIWVNSLNDILAEPKLSRYAQLYLFSHQAFSGSCNNDGTKVENTINQKCLLPFTKSFFGHYHNYQEPFLNAFQLSAWKQKNFGEDEEKGFWLLKESEGELDVEFRKSEFPAYVTFEVEAQDLTPEQISKLKDDVKESSSKVRLKLIGTTDEIKSVSIKELQDAGIKVKPVDKVERQMIEEGEEVQDYEKGETLIDAFKEFCTEKEYDYEEGITYLKLALNG